ncbi:MAG: discoidin domain-containing protein [Elusimicrobiota bacterium]
MNKTFLCCVVVFSAIAVACAQPAGWKVTASSFEKDLMKPENVLDENMQTRWSSEFSDPQWLQLDFGKSKDICGLVINWEAAYGKTYDVQVSESGTKWETVYSVVDGDGSTDDIFFAKTKTRYIRIFGKERGTSWGYSVWEVKVRGSESVPVVDSSSKIKGCEAENIFDGKMETGWKSAPGDEEWLSVDLKAPKQIGGLEIYWGNDYAREYEIHGYSGDSWKSLFTTSKGNGGKDTAYMDMVTVSKIRISMIKSSGSGYGIQEIIFKGPDEAATPQKTFELAAMEAPVGYYPRWLVKQQVYWTVLGVDRDPAESLFSEDGAIEPFFHSFSIEPFLYINDSLISYGQAEVSQSLEKSYLPIPTVTWKTGGLEFRQTAFAAGELGESGSYVRYTIENKTPDEINGKLFIAVRPFQVNPPWQYGGLTEIRSIKFDKTTFPAVFVNGTAAVVSFSEPSGFGAQKTEDGEVVETLKLGLLPPLQELTDKDKYASGALEYAFTIPSGGIKEYYSYVPMYKASIHEEVPAGKTLGEYFNTLLQANIKTWETRLDTIKIGIPEKEIIDAMKTHLAYILINRDGPLVQPGPRNYQRSWMRDGAIINAALLRTGFAAEAREYVDFMVTMQEPDGFVPFMVEVNKMPDWARSWTEYDSQGEFVYAIMDIYRFTNKKSILKKYMPAAKKSMQYIRMLRNTRMTEEYSNGPDDMKKFYGLVPPSNSHEGYFPAVHSYWDDFFTLKGWKDMAEMAGILGDKDTKTWANDQTADFRKTFYDSMRLVMQLKNLDTLPASADYADFDPTSTSIGLFPCEEYDFIPRPQLDNTFNKYYEETFLPKLKSDWKGGYTPYEQRNALSFLIMGQKDRALAMVRYFVSASRPRAWNELAEVVFDNYRHPQYIGDMPHTWISAEVVSTIRSLFIYENKDTLELAKGVDGKWLREGDGVSVSNAPTYWGNVSYTAKQEGDMLKINVSGKVKPPNGFSFALPEDEKLKELKINGKTIQEIAGGEIKFSKLPAEIIAVLERK